MQTLRLSIPSGRALFCYSFSLSCPLHTGPQPQFRKETVTSVSSRMWRPPQICPTPSQDSFMLQKRKTRLQAPISVPVPGQGKSLCCLLPGAQDVKLRESVQKITEFMSFCLSRLSLVRRAQLIFWLSYRLSEMIQIITDVC